MATEKTSLDTIVCAAVEIASAQERDAYIAQACGEDRALRGRVDKLVAAHFRAGSFLDGPAGPVVATIDAPVSQPHGTVIGPYKLLQQIGEGGMGTVWMAEQQQPMQRRVALKIIKAGMDSRQVIARFEAERQALAMMDHLNIARVFDAGATEAGLPYFVMELVHGVPITKYCDDNHLTPRERLELFVPVCQAIQHAHQKGIIHRDIKPSNVMVTLYDGKPVPKVIDFGVAKATEQKLTERTLFTQYGTMVGTLEYMSPEQAEMSALGVDTRSDIYSLGVLLYELLTGSTPLNRKRIREAAYGEILRMIKEVEPPKPSTRLSDSGEALASISAQRKTEPAKLTKLVRGELDWIVMKCLEKDRNRRYETANGFAADVQRYLNDETVQACPPSTAYRFRKFARRNKAALVMGSVVAGALVLAVVALSVSNLFVAHERDQKARALSEKELALANESAALVKETAARAKATEQEALAEERAVEARKQQKIAEAQELLARRRFYAAQMNLAVRAWEEGDTPRVLELLESQRPRFGEEDLRAFEWYALWQLCHQQLRFSWQGTAGFSESGIGGAIHTVAFSPDSSLVALGRSDGTVKLFDAAGGRELTTLRANGSSASGAIAFSPDGKTLAQATSPTPDEVILWDLATSRQRLVLSGTGRVHCLAFSPDGGTLAAGNGAGAVQLWDPAAGRLKETIQLGDGWVATVAFSPDGKTLATSRKWAGAVTSFWDLTLTPARKTREVPERGFAAAFSPDGKHFAVTIPSVLRLFETGTWTKVPVKVGPWGNGRGLAFTPDGRSIAVGVDARFVKVLDLKSGQGPTFAHNSPVHSIAVSPDGKALASVSADAILKVWNLSPGANSGLIDVQGGVSCLAFSQDNRTLAVGTNEKIVQLFDVVTGEQKARLTGHSQPIAALAFLANGKALASGSGTWSDAMPGELKMWDLRTGQELERYPEFKGTTYAIALAPDQRTLAVGGPHGAALCDVADPRPRVVLKTGGPTRLAFSPDGKTLISASANKLALLDPVTGAERLSIYLKESSVATMALACAPDGKLVAAGNQVGVLRLWELPSGRLHAALRGNTTSINSAAFFPDGKTLATANASGEVKLWDVATGQERITFKYGNVLALSPDGKILATWYGGPLRILRAATTPEAFARKNELNPDDPESPLAAIDSGDRLWAAGDKPEAEKAYRRAQERLRVLVEQFPLEVGYRRELVRSGLSLQLLLADRGAAGEAEQVWKQVQVTSRQLPADEQLALARRYSETGDMLRTAGAKEAALRAFTQAIELKPDDSSLWFRRAYAYGAAGEAEKAIADYLKVVDLNPKGTGAWNNLGVAHDSLKQHDKAIAYYSKAVEVGPTNALPWNNRGRRHRELGRHEKALDDFSRAVELQPTNLTYRLDRALSAEKLGRAAEALADYSRVIELDSTNAAAWYRRAACNARMGRHFEASGDYQKVLELAPSSPAGLNNLAWLLATCEEPKVRDSARAVELAKKAVELDPKQGTYWNTLGVARFRAADWKAANEALTRSMDLRQGGDAFDWFFLAMSHWKRNRQEEARAFYDRAVEWMDRNTPKDDELRRFRTEAEEVLGIKK